MAKTLLSRIIGRIRKTEYEPEYEEAVEHDTVMVMRDGKLVEVTSDDPEVRQ